MTMIAITMCVVFLLGMLAFGCSIPLCVLGIILSIAIVLNNMNLLPLKGMSEKTMKMVQNAAFVLLFVIGAFTSMGVAEGGIHAYEDLLESAMTLIEKDKLDDAWEEINLIKETYGSSDNTIVIETIAYIAEGSYDTAMATLNGYSDRRSIDYYTLLETVYLSSGSDNVDNLYRLYTEAANHHPSWTYVQQMAGIAYLSRSDFARAEYFLLRAYEQEPADYKSAYYLGVTCYEQRRVSDAVTFFNESIEREPDDEILSYIAWYLEEIGERGEDDV